MTNTFDSFYNLLINVHFAWFAFFGQSVLQHKKSMHFPHTAYLCTFYDSYNNQCYFPTQHWLLSLRSKCIVYLL